MVAVKPETVPLRIEVQDERHSMVGAQSGRGPMLAPPHVLARAGTNLRGLLHTSPTAECQLIRQPPVPTFPPVVPTRSGTWNSNKFMNNKRLLPLSPCPRVPPVICDCFGKTSWERGRAPNVPRKLTMCSHWKRHRLSPPVGQGTFSHRS